MQSPPITWIVVLAVLAIAYAAYNNSRKAIRLPPGPPALPFLGNWRELRGKAAYSVLTRWGRLHGDFYSYRVGSTPVVVFGGAEAFEDVFYKKGALYNSRPLTSAQSHRVVGDSRGVMLPYGEPWRDRRRILQTLLSGPGAKVFQPYQEFESRVTLLKLQEKPELFYQEMLRYSSSVTFGMLLGARHESAEGFVPTRIREEMTLFWQHISPGCWLTDWFPFLDVLPDRLAPWREKADRMRRRWDCFLTRLLDQPDINRFSHEDKVGIVAEILSAGTETTISSLQWFFRAALFFPDAFALAREEIDRVVGPDRLPDWQDRPDLPYVEALVQELHRWASVSPLGVAHATTSDDVYRGSHVPQGTTVIANLYGVHHDPTTYPDPDRFLPARFLPPDHPLHAHGMAAVQKHFAFGVGRRACPGLQVANSSLYIVISRILWAFDINPGPSGLPQLKTLPSPLTLNLAPFECSVTPRGQRVRELVGCSAETLTPPAELESASVYERLVAEWDKAAV
ncbi:cytochrome P450 [Plectosphaerella cucumerina]|uniref:Cytochrome P450 n=1 Tax=Plectosphaerella cucumerina TaxID=40658 RepID=A0A8K0TCW7_9PEZI|nr:cytochrome P450 [Plectosphaerella cucumerina]